MASKRKTDVIGNCSNEIGIGERWSALLRDHVYLGSNKAKRIQRDWGVSLSTAYLWLGGAKPTTDQIERARSLWGDIVIQFLFGRMPIRSVDERLSAVEQEIAALKSGTENGVVQNHRGTDAAVSNLASGSERAQGPLVEGAQGQVAPSDAGQRLVRAQIISEGRKQTMVRR